MLMQEPYNNNKLLFVIFNFFLLDIKYQMFINVVRKLFIIYSTTPTDTEQIFCAFVLKKKMHPQK